MINELSQEEINEYADNAQTINKPTGVNWTKGVMVGKTAPAKWWNWMFREVTKIVREARSDASNMLTELKNVITDSGAEIDPDDNTQLSAAVDTKSDNAVTKYVNNKRSPGKVWTRPVPYNPDNYYHHGCGAVMLVNGNYLLDDMYSDDGGMTYKKTNLTIPKGETIEHYGVVFKGIAYFIGTNCTLEGVESTGGSRLYRCVDGKTWELIYVPSDPDDEESGTTSYAYGIDVVHDVMFLAIGGNITNRTLIYTTDGETFNNFIQDAAYRQGMGFFVSYANGYWFANKTATSSRLVPAKVIKSNLNDEQSFIDVNIPDARYGFAAIGYMNNKYYVLKEVNSSVVSVFCTEDFSTYTQVFNKCYMNYGNSGPFSSGASTFVVANNSIIVAFIIDKCITLGVIHDDDSTETINTGIQCRSLEEQFTSNLIPYLGIAVYNGNLLMPNIVEKVSPDGEHLTIPRIALLPLTDLNASPTFIDVPNSGHSCIVVPSTQWCTPNMMCLYLHEHYKIIATNTLITVGSTITSIKGINLVVNGTLYLK